MTDQMTSRQRVLAAIRRQPVDHVPCVPSFNPLSRRLREGHRWNFPWPEHASTEEILRYQLETLDTDALVDVEVDIVRPEPGITSKTWIEGELLHKTCATASGDLHAAVRYNELWPHGEDIPFYSDFNIGHFVEPWIRTEADLECFKHVHQLREDVETLAAARGSLAEARALADTYELAVQGHVGLGLTGAQQLFGANELCLMTMDNPGLVDAYLEYEHRINLRCIELASAGGVDTIRRDGFYETADFYGPAMLERFLGRRLEAETDAAHSGGMSVSYTIHTGIMPILEYLGNLTVDSLFGIDTGFGGVDLNRVRDALAPSKSFFTGPSSTYHIWRGPEATRRAVREVFDVFGRTGLIITQCVSSHSIMPWESTLAMVDEWRRLRS